jgi:3-hydroxyisobutyrate dehydrogenase-like beta-hydroxyacid dehydrogenase
LIVKDVTTALGIGKEVGVPMFIAGLVQQLYQLAQAIQGPQAPNQSAVKLYEEWSGVENRAK